MVRHWWKLLNTAVFYGKLHDLSQIDFIRHKKEHAWAIPLNDGKIRLTIQPTFSSRKLFLMVLVHEMVHGWDHFHDEWMRHGTLFHGWKNRIKRTTNLDLKTRLKDAY